MYFEDTNQMSLPVDWMWDVRKRGVENRFQGFGLVSVRTKAAFTETGETGEVGEEQFGRGDIRCLI